MKLHVINTGFFKLDGGAMFGVVPKSIWQRTNPADENNMCTWAMRCLLIEDGDQLILIDTGIGDKQDDKFFGYFYLHGDDTLIQSIHKAGFSQNDITDVFLTHLHFDHCGGAVVRTGNTLKPAFPNARYWSNKDHWDWATNPNPREMASFLTENILPIKESGQLNMVSNGSSPLDGFEIITVDGHTEKQMIPVITYKGKKIVYMADLLPSTGHIPLPYVMGYDVRPLVTLKEKEAFLNTAAEENYFLFLEHDPVNEICTVKKTDRGVRLEHTLSLNDIL